MQENPKSQRLLKGLVTIAIVGLISFFSWDVWHRHNNTSNTNSVVACSISVPDTSSSQFQLPNGWNWYEIKDIGLKYAYPASWKDLTTPTNTASGNYVFSFTEDLSGANIQMTLAPNCSDLQSNLADINSGQFDILSGTATTKAIGHDQASYSAISHWESGAGNQYQLLTSRALDFKRYKALTISYSVITGAESCPDNQLATTSQTKCPTQSISSELDNLIKSLQPI